MTRGNSETVPAHTDHHALASVASVWPDSSQRRDTQWLTRAVQNWLQHCPFPNRLLPVARVGFAPLR